jgi:hypothetical protein
MSLGSKTQAGGCGGGGHARWGGTVWNGNCKLRRTERGGQGGSGWSGGGGGEVRGMSGSRSQ